MMEAYISLSLANPKSHIFEMMDKQASLSLSLNGCVSIGASRVSLVGGVDNGCALDHR